MQKRIINFAQSISEQVEECLEKAEIGLSPSGLKSYTCKYSCIINNKTEESKRNKFTNRIVRKLETIKIKSTNLEECEIEISIGPKQINNKFQV